MPAIIPLKILIVEDDQDDANLLVDFLAEAKRFQAIPTVVYTYKEGKQRLKTAQYDIVLLDYKLPDGDGIEFLNDVRKYHYRTPFILVTNYGDRNLQDQVLELGASEYLEKGRITAEVLERTCLYAISLHEKRVQNGGGPGVGPLIQQLVDLTRETVTAQVEATTGLRSIKEGLDTGFLSVNKNLDEHDAAMERRTQKMITEVHAIPKFRWLLDWVAEHPWITVLIFFLAVGAVCLAVYALGEIDTQKVKDLKDIKSSLQQIPSTLRLLA